MLRAVVIPEEIIVQPGFPVVILARKAQVIDEALTVAVGIFIGLVLGNGRTAVRIFMLDRGAEL